MRHCGKNWSPMVAKLLISSSLEQRKIAIQRLLHIGSVTADHVDVLYFKDGEKLGIESSRKIKDHFAYKPTQAKGKVVAMESADKMTVDAQNALLKTIEELPKDGLIILSASSDANFLPTILSRCQITTLQPPRLQAKEGTDYSEHIEKLIKLGIPERFEYIEKLKDREEFLKALTKYFHNQLISHPRGVTSEFLKELLEAEKWAAQNVNIRGILEYLMLVMPS